MTRADLHVQPYREQIARASTQRKTRIVLAIDTADGSVEKQFRKSKKLVDESAGYVCGVKLGRQTVLNLGTRRTQGLARIVHENGVPCIVDDKINDIGETNRAIADAYFRIGFDGLTANPFVGWRDGLEPLFRNAHRQGKGVILLGYMSHLGASEGYGQKVLTRKKASRLQYQLFAEKALRWGADGVVVGATRPEIVREFRAIVRDKVPIYSPGIGAQGGRLKESLRAGTDYFIIGRSITRDPYPGRAASRLARESWD